ncbi:hypothetical protein TNCV_287291 [Trichonephila clavipes]|nr:hypothetical protein TNCV_287291 [Trichonephila clavipes]
MWSDESRFQLQHVDVRMWRKLKENGDLICTATTVQAVGGYIKDFFYDELSTPPPTINFPVTLLGKLTQALANQAVNNIFVSRRHKDESSFLKMTFINNQG